MTEPMLAMLRRDEREQMRSHVRFETVEQQWDDTSGSYDDVIVETHYNGDALITTKPDRLQEVEAGEGQAGLVLYRVAVDRAADVPRKARGTVVDSRDPALVGRVMWVFDYDLSDHRLNRVLVCREGR